MTAERLDELLGRYAATRRRTVWIAEASELTGQSPRMLRYREALGLIPRAQSVRRRYTPQALAAASFAAELEHRHGVGPQAIAFALQAQSDPELAGDLRRLRALVLPAAEPVRALEFDQRKAEALLTPGPPSRP